MKRLSIIFYLFATVIPLGAGLLYACLYSIGAVGLLSQGFTLEHWEELLTSDHFWSSLGYSIYIAVFSLIVSLSMAVLISLNISRRRVKSGPEYTLYIPLSFPPIVAGFAFFLLFIDSGFVSRALFQIGLTQSIQSFPDFVGGKGGLAIVFAHIFLATPFFSLLFKHTYKNEQIEDLEFLGSTLGARPLQNLRKIVIPIFLYKNRTTILLYFIFMIGAYEIPLILGSQSLRMVSVLVIDTMTRFDLGAKPLAYAYAVFFSGLVLLFTLLVMKQKVVRR